MDPRHQKRIQIVQNLFAASFKTNKDNFPFPNEQKTKKILAKTKRIDALIEKFAAKFPPDKIAKTDLAILRLSIYDLLFEPDIPPKVVIDEAVELSKDLSSEKSYAFINAILGNVFLELYPKKPNVK